MTCHHRTSESRPDQALPELDSGLTLLETTQPRSTTDRSDYRRYMSGITTLSLWRDFGEQSTEELGQSVDRDG